MWPLFVAIGVGFLILLAYGWGLATGVKLGKNAQARDQEALRAAAHAALTAHERERLAWRSWRDDVSDSAADGPQPARAGAASLENDPAELAHDRTRRAFLALGVAWGDSGLDEQTPKS